ncbi:MAG: flagellar basal body rod protein FlgC [Oscillospiraceae bacterium]|nr:flagellar basal body rod protein FlgC [Oscillospiraceae bacterium]
MNIFKAMDISGSALTAQRYRMDIIGENIANADSTRTADGSLYKRKNVIFQERPLSFSDHMNIAVSNSSVRMARAHHYSDNQRYASTLLGRRLQTTGGGGVRVVSHVESQQPEKLVYDPEHPDANEDGYVAYPNVDIEREMVDFISATRSYEANVTAINNFKNIAMKALEIGR